MDGAADAVDGGAGGVEKRRWHSFWETDQGGTNARPVTWKFCSLKAMPQHILVAHILALLQAYAPVLLLFGIPRNMDGSYGPQAEKVRAFSKSVLSVWNGEYDFFDERLTTVSAERVLINADVSRKKRKQVVDKLAAVVILQAYLDSGRNRG